MALLGPRGAGDRVLSDAEWGQVAASVIERTGFASEGDERAVRWVAVRHAADHVHIVVTLARQDGGHVKTWNDFFRVREACRAAERRLGLTATAPAAGPPRSEPAALRQSRRPGAGGTRRPRNPAAGSVRGGRRGGLGAGVLRPAGAGRGSGAKAAQHGSPR